MKKVILILSFILLSWTGMFAQKKERVEYRQNWDKQTVFWGYYLGINRKEFKISYLNNTSFVDVEPGVGFEVGLIGDLRLHKNISLRLEPGLSSNSKTLVYTQIPGGEKDSLRQVNGTYLRIPLLLKLNADRYNNIRPYLVGGVSYDYNFSSNQDNPNDNFDGEFRMKKNNFTYEIGAGIDIYLPYFIFSPSIRGVFAINNELVKDNNPNSPWTGQIDYFGTRGLFLKLAFH
ncbi:porin family protein [Lutibacter sp.]|uniref:type IX secretion/gliding motility protein PorT/SprT n=1 Tax=Lutibacter sp. TaxID=1925666 RepID=UPI002735C8DE|nr:porin family protein [Lutibacter sp.]MDP3311747.1 porin family protein [Lutibacter sp.]